MAITAEQKKDNSKWLHLALLAVVTVLAYSNVFNAGFISWDDAEYVLQNPDVQSLSAENMSKWFSSFYIGNYHPLTMLSYAIDFMIGKQEPFIYHTTNIILHTLNAVVLYAFIETISKNRNVAFFTALIFAIHPVQTESVSWIAERKNVLYGLFFLLSLWAYAKYVVSSKKQMLVWVILAGIAAMLSKATAVALPLSLLAVDVWMKRPLKDKAVWLEKLPLLLLAIPVGLVAIKAQEQGTFLNLHPEYSWFQRILFAGYAYTQYIVQLSLPVKLSVLYPYPKEAGAVHIVFSAFAIGIVALMIIA